MPLVSGAPAAAARTAAILDVFASRQGEGLCVGDPQVFVRFGGCNLACDYCDTPESIPLKAGTSWRLDALLERVEALDPDGRRAVSLTGGEPLLQADFLASCIPALKRRGRLIYLETNGTLPRALERVIDGCDCVAMDFKLESATGHHLWEAHQWFLKVGAGKTFVKIVLTAATTEEELRRGVELISSVHPQAPLILQPATPWAGVKPVSLERLHCWWRLASRRLKDVRILPQVHRLWGIP